MFKTFHGASKSDRIAARVSFIPKGSKLVPGPAGGAVYTYEVAGKVYALAFRGTAARPEWHHAYKTDEQRQQHVTAFHDSIKHSADYKAKRQAERSAWVNTAKVGDVLYTSWGYDQTNVEFYVVTRVSGKRVWIREIAQDSETTGFMSGKCWPAMPIRMCGEETMHIARQSDNHGYAVKINESATAWLEQGRDHYMSSYA